MSRNSLVEIFHDTLHVSKKLYPFSGHTAVVTQDFADNFSDTIYKNKKGIVLGVVDMDCIMVAQHFATKGYAVGLINMANNISRGGGVRRGARAQEEHLCRTSNLYDSLSQIDYPFEEDECVISTDVRFFKDSSYTMSKPYTCDVISVCAPILNDSSDWTEKHAEMVKSRIRLMLKTAAASGNNCIVLSALGCGAFCNPPKQVSDIFKEVLIDEHFVDYFNIVVFAVIDDHNSNGNLETFTNTFGKYNLAM